MRARVVFAGHAGMPPTFSPLNYPLRYDGFTQQSKNDFLTDSCAFQPLDSPQPPAEHQSRDRDWNLTHIVAFWYPAEKNYWLLATLKKRKKEKEERLIWMRESIWPCWSEGGSWREPMQTGEGEEANSTHKGTGIEPMIFLMWLLSFFLLVGVLNLMAFFFFFDWVVGFFHQRFREFEWPSIEEAKHLTFDPVLTTWQWRLVSVYVGMAKGWSHISGEELAAPPKSVHTLRSLIQPVRSWGKDP